MDIFLGPLVCSQASNNLLKNHEEFEINVLKFNIEKKKETFLHEFGQKKYKLIERN